MEVGTLSRPARSRLPRGAGTGVHWLLGAAFLVLLVVAFAMPLERLATFWQQDEYSHGPFIPLIAAFLLWHRLADARPQPNTSWLGVLVTLLGILLLLVGQLSTFVVASLYGFVLGLCGLILACYGRSTLWAGLPALAFLVFAIPLPHIFYVMLSANLQLLSSTLGVAAIDWMGLPVFQEGNVIDLGGYKLQVAEACSGLRYLFPLMSFGYIAAYLLDDRWWKRVLLFLSTIPITIVMNSLRIALIGVTVDRWGIEAAGGVLHEFEGWTVFFACIVILSLEIALLLRIGRGGRFRLDKFGLAHGPVLAGTPRVGGPPVAGLVLAGVAAFASMSGVLEERSVSVPLRHSLSEFSMQLGDWTGRAQALEPDVLNALQLTDYLLADYGRRPSEPSVNLYMAYYATQEVGSSAHSPADCIPGGGWQIASSGDTKVPIAAENGAPLHVRRFVIQRDGDRQLVYYWFNQRGRDLTNQYLVKWYLLKDAILRHRTDGSLLRLVTALPPGESEAEADARLRQFLQVSEPAARTFLPAPAI